MGMAVCSVVYPDIITYITFVRQAVLCPGYGFCDTVWYNACVGTAKTAICNTLLVASFTLVCDTVFGTQERLCTGWHNTCMGMTVCPVVYLDVITYGTLVF